MANIETLEVTDLDECIKVINAFKQYDFFVEYRDEAFLKEYCQKLLGNGKFVVEYHNDIPVGFIGFYCNDIETKTCFVTTLLLSDELGFMKGKTFFRLTTKAIQIIKDAGMENVRLEVDKENKKALQLYKHLGFEIISDNNDKSYFMELKLNKLTTKLSNKKDQ